MLKIKTTSLVLLTIAFSHKVSFVRCWITPNYSYEDAHCTCALHKLPVVLICERGGLLHAAVDNLKHQTALAVALTVLRFTA